MTRHRRLSRNTRSTQRAYRKAKKADRQAVRRHVRSIVDGGETNRIPREELDWLFGRTASDPEARPVRSAKPVPWWHKYWPPKRKDSEP